MAKWLTFWERVVKREAGCWEWIGGKEHGYGRVWDREEQRVMYAHQVSYREMVGPLLPGHQIHHKCGTRECVNPEHLEQLSQADHLSEHPRRLKSHCKYGHPLTAGNYYTYGNRRFCKPCALMRAKKQRRG